MKRDYATGYLYPFFFCILYGICPVTAKYTGTFKLGNLTHLFFSLSLVQAKKQRISSRSVSVKISIRCLMCFFIFFSLSLFFIGERETVWDPEGGLLSWTQKFPGESRLQAFKKKEFCGSESLGYGFWKVSSVGSGPEIPFCGSDSGNLVLWIRIWKLKSVYFFLFD